MPIRGAQIRFVEPAPALALCHFCGSQIAASDGFSVNRCVCGKILFVEGELYERVESPSSAMLGDVPQARRRP